MWEIFSVAETKLTQIPLPGTDTFSLSLSQYKAGLSISRSSCDEM